MTKKGIIGLILVLSLVVIGTTALAQGPGYGRRGSGPGYGGFGQCWGPGTDARFNEETAKLREDLYRKRVEMRDLLAAPKVDGSKVKALQGEINRLQNELADKRLAGALEFKKNNPDWRPGYGYGQGQGYGHGRGRGPGGCRR